MRNNLKKSFSIIISVGIGFIIFLALFKSYSHVISPSADTIEDTEILASVIKTNKNENSNSSNSFPNQQTNQNTTIKTYEIPILMYHYIREMDENDEAGNDLSVSPVNFQKQLELIKDLGYETVTFADIENGNLPEKPIILTFDDGYQDFYLNAYPALKKKWI